MSKKLYLFIIVLAILFVPIFVANAQYGIDVTAGKTPVKEFMSVSLQEMIGGLLGGVLSLVGIIFFALMVYGGVIWMSAAGNQEREKKAGGIMIGATIGVVLVLSSYVLVSFLFDKVGSGEKITTPTAETAPVITNTTVAPTVKKCEVDDTGVGIIDICGDLYSEDESGCGESTICTWDLGSLICKPKGTEEALCSVINDPEGCKEGDFDLICEWK